MGTGLPAGVRCHFKKAVLSLLLILTTAGLALTFAGYFGSWRYFEITSDFRPYYLGLGLVCLLGTLAVPGFAGWSRIRLTAILGAAAMLMVNGIEVLPGMFARPSLQAQPLNGKFKAMAFNVEGSNTRFAETRAFVEREVPDIAMFCEMTTRWSQELKPVETLLKSHIRVDEMDIEVFSRHPILRHQVFHFGPERGFVLVVISINGVELSFVGVHTYPRAWRGAEGFRERTLALEQGIGSTSRSFSPPLLVMGDFNASQWTPAYKKMLDASGLMDAQKGHGLIWTHHGHGLVSRWLWSPIDHCIHSPDVLVSRFAAGPDLNSDHLPIVVEFAFTLAHRR
jgi:endonuclease/exonuclease/phosphatase (EEP) superfamily protein YafD